jgi:hypothetical protein
MGESGLKRRWRIGGELVGVATPRQLCNAEALGLESDVIPLIFEAGPVYTGFLGDGPILKNGPVGLAEGAHEAGDFVGGEFIGEQGVEDSPDDAGGPTKVPLHRLALLG